jgi:hypothetical protein
VICQKTGYQTRRCRPHKLTDHQKREEIKRRERGDESLTEIRSYNVSAATISRLAL